MIQNEAFSSINGCIRVVHPEVGVGWRILGEGLLTSVWVFIYLMTVTNGTPNGKKVGPFAVGLYVIVARMARYVQHCFCRFLVVADFMLYHYIFHFKQNPSYIWCYLLAH